MFHVKHKEKTLEIAKKFVSYMFAIHDIEESLEYESVFINIRGNTLNVQVRSQDDFHDVYLYNRYSYPMGDVEKIVTLLNL